MPRVNNINEFPHNLTMESASISPEMLNDSLRTRIKLTNGKCSKALEGTDESKYDSAYAQSDKLRKDMLSYLEDKEKNDADAQKKAEEAEKQRIIDQKAQEIADKKLAEENEKRAQEQARIEAENERRQAEADAKAKKQAEKAEKERLEKEAADQKKAEEEKERLEKEEAKNKTIETIRDMVVANGIVTTEELSKLGVTFSPESLELPIGDFALVRRAGSDKFQLKTAEVKSSSNYENALIWGVLGALGIGLGWFFTRKK